MTMAAAVAGGTGVTVPLFNRVSWIGDPGGADVPGVAGGTGRGNGITERMSVRPELTNNVVAGVVVVVLPVCLMVPPPVAVTLNDAPHARVGIVDGVMTMGMLLVTLAGGVAPSPFVMLTVLVCPAESVIATIPGSRHPPNVVALNPLPLLFTTPGATERNCGKVFDIVYGGAPPKIKNDVITPSEQV